METIYNFDPNWIEWVAGVLLYLTIGWWSVFEVNKGGRNNKSFKEGMGIYWFLGMLIIPATACAWGWIISISGAIAIIVTALTFFHKSAELAGDRCREKKSRLDRQKADAMKILKKELGEETYKELFE